MRRFFRLYVTRLLKSQKLPLRFFTDTSLPYRKLIYENLSRRFVNHFSIYIPMEASEKSLNYTHGHH